MNVQTKTHAGAGLVLGSCVILGLSWTPVRGDDLNPPSYRGQPLSVHAHWATDPSSGLLSLNQFSWVDDSDPLTYMHPILPSTPVVPGFDNLYWLQLPNFVDELPTKFMRLQLTWSGTTQPPLSIFSNALELGQLIPGAITYSSTPLVFTQPDGGYQYFDIEFHPNPDFEDVYVKLPSDGRLEQVVIDTISIPEPATLGLLAFGGLALMRWRK